MSRSSACTASEITPPRSSLFDYEYVRRLSRADPDTEQHFLEYFGVLVSTKLEWRLRSPDQVQSARRETFARVLALIRLKGGLEHPERLGGLVNAVCNDVLLETSHTDEPGTPMASCRPDHVPDESQRSEEARQAFESLPPPDRNMLRLMFAGGVDRSEVCRRLQVADADLDLLLHGAKARFRARYRSPIASVRVVEAARSNTSAASSVKPSTR